MHAIFCTRVLNNLQKVDTNLSCFKFIVCTPDVSHKKFRARIKPLKLVGTTQLWFFKHNAISDADLQSQQ